MLSVALVLASCSTGKGGAAPNSESPAVGAVGAGPGVPKEAYEMAKAKVLDVGFKNCGDFWGSVYKKDNALDFTSPSEYQFKNLEMKVETFPTTLSEADKLNGIQWQGQISMSADVTRERPTGKKEWYPWANGFGAPALALSMQEVNGKFTIRGLQMNLRAACPQ